MDVGTIHTSSSIRAEASPTASSLQAVHALVFLLDGVTRVETDVCMNELKYKVAQCLDVMEFLDIIGMSMEDVVERFEEEIEEYEEQLERACR